MFEMLYVNNPRSNCQVRGLPSRRQDGREIICRGFNCSSRSLGSWNYWYVLPACYSRDLGISLVTICPLKQICLYFAVDLLKRAAIQDTSPLVAGPNGQKYAYFVQKPVFIVLPEQEWTALGSNFTTRLLLNISLNTDVTNSSDITTIVSVGSINVSLTKSDLFIDLIGEKYAIPVTFAAGFQNISIDFESGYMLAYVNCVGYNVTLSSSMRMLFKTGSKSGTLTIADPSPLIVGTQCLILCRSR